MSSVSNDSNSVKVTGTVEAPVQKKFEWNTGLLYSHNANHSKARTVTVGILATVTGLFLISMLLDLGRRVAFSLGKCDGKSYSLIDKATPTMNKVAESVKNRFKTQELSPAEKIEVLNQASQKERKKLVSQIVQTYRDQQGGRFSNHSTFDTRSSRKATEKRFELQKSLAENMKRDLERNATSADFDLRVDRLKNEVKTMFDAEAKAEVFFLIKGEYNPEFIRDVGFQEFDGGSEHITSSLDEALPMARIRVAQNDYLKKFPEMADNADAQLVGANEAAAELMKTLKKAVVEKKLTPAQALQAVGQIGVSVQRVLLVRNNDPVEGEKAGIRASRQIRNEAIKAGLLTNPTFNATSELKLLNPHEGLYLGHSQKENLPELTTQAALQIAEIILAGQGGYEAGSDEAAQAEKNGIGTLPAIAEELVQKGELDISNVTKFTNDTQSKVKEFTTNSEALNAARPKLSEKTEEKSAEMEAASVARSASIKEAQEQFEKRLTAILNKQAVLLGEKHGSYAGLVTKQEEINRRYKDLVRKEVVVTEGTSKNKMTLLSAVAYRAAHIEKVNKQRMEPEKKLKALNEIPGFDAEVMELLGSLDRVVSEEKEHLAVMVRAQIEIDTLHKEIKGMISEYQVFAKANSSVFKAIEKEKRTDLQKMEGEVLANDRLLDREYKKVHNKLGIMDSLFAPKKKGPATAAALPVEADKAEVSPAEKEEEFVPPFADEPAVAVPSVVIEDVSDEE